MKQLVWVAAICCLMPMAARAQSATADPISNRLRALLDSEAKNLVATAQEFPVEKYTFHPTPEGMTVGATMSHIAQVNNRACALVSGAQPPAYTKPGETDKDQLVAGLQASMDFCRAQFATLTDAKLADPIPGREGTRFGAVLEVTNDLIDHYATLSVYMRINGLLPPTAQKKP